MKVSSDDTSTKDALVSVLPQPVRDDTVIQGESKRYLKWHPRWKLIGGDPGEVIVLGSDRELIAQYLGVEWPRRI